MAWQERYYIDEFTDARNEELVGRDDDWVIPYRTCTDFSGNDNQYVQNQLNFATTNSPSVTYDGFTYVFHGFIYYVPTQEINDFGGYASRAYKYNLSSSLGDVTSPSTDYRMTHIRPVPYAAYDSSACLHISNIHIFGGQEKVGGTLYDYHYKYNPSTDTYAQLESMPAARQGHSSISVGNYIYVMGGGYTTTWRYDVENDTWSTMSSMPRARESFGVVEYNNKIYAFGGAVGGTYQAVIDVYDIDADSWSTLASSKNMPTARRHLQVQRIGTDVVTFGGLISSTNHTNKVEIFDLSSETWDTSLDGMIEDRSRFCSSVWSGYVYAMFGFYSFDFFGDTVEFFQFSTERIDLSALIGTPSIPTNLTLNAISPNQIDVSWDTQDSATYFELEYGISPSGTLTTISNIQGDKFSLYNLSQDTTYRVRVKACNSLGCSSYTSYTTTTTPFIPSTPTNLTGGTIARVDAGLNVVWDTVTGATLYKVRIKPSGGSYLYYTTSSTNYSFTSLSYGVSYLIGVRAENSYGYSSYTSDEQLTTAPKTPTISLNSKGDNNISIDFNVGSGNWSFVKLWYRVSGSGSGFSSITVNSPTTNGDIISLDADTEYEIKASSFYTVTVEGVDADLESRDASGYVDFSDSLFIKTTGGRPSDWSWSYTIDTDEEVYLVSGKDIFLMPATEWNDETANSFVGRINEFRDYKSLSNYTFTSISSGTTVTKEIINQALNAIRDMSAHFTGDNTLISNRVAGQNILEANIYINMKDCLNSIL